MVKKTQVREFEQGVVGKGIRKEEVDVDIGSPIDEEIGLECVQTD